MAGKVITPRQLAQQWLRLPNKFEVNVFNFETLVGNAAKKIFRDSFYLRRFNSAGTFSWQSRRNHKPHPILEETGEYKTQKTSTFRKQDILSLLLMIGVTGIFIYFEGLWK